MTTERPEPAAPVVVLLVEDDFLIQELVAPALTEVGYEVRPANSGEEAITALENNESGPIRAVITDIDLGRSVTGWDVAHRARELHPDIAVVYVTGAAAADWSAHGVPNSVLVLKPFVPVQVVTAVSELLNVKSPPTPTQSPSE